MAILDSEPKMTLQQALAVVLAFGEGLEGARPEIAEAIDHARAVVIEAARKNALAYISHYHGQAAGNACDGDLFPAAGPLHPLD